MANRPGNVLPIGIGVVLVVLSGVIHGIQTDRWGQSEKVLEAARRLEQVPTQFGDWSGTPTEMSERELKQAEAAGYYAQKFVNTQDGSEVSVMILCGRPGPISVHPPTVCFVGAGWSLQQEPSKSSIPESDSGSLWKGKFGRSMEGMNIAIETHWGWSAGDEWQAFGQPRLETAGYPFLYKMYVTMPATNQSEEDIQRRLDSFLGEFLPRLNEALFPKAESKG